MRTLLSAAASAVAQHSASQDVSHLLQILRQKRMYENQRETLYNQQFNMEQTRFTVESIQVCTCWPCMQPACCRRRSCQDAHNLARWLTDLPLLRDCCVLRCVLRSCRTQCRQCRR